MSAFSKTMNMDGKYIDAPNIVVDNKCKQCEKDDIDIGELVSCLFCCNYFHAINCADDQSKDVSPKTVYANQLLPAITNTGSFEKRPGNFKFICDFCMTSFENNQCGTNGDKVKKLDDKVESLASDMTEIKSMLTILTKSPQDFSKSESPVTPEQVNNVWNDTTRSKNVRSMLVLKNDGNGNQVDKAVLEKTFVQNGIQVQKTFVNKSNETCIVLPSEKTASNLITHLNNDLSQYPVVKLKSRLPTINIVGLPCNVDKGELVSNILKLNPEIKSVCDNSNTNISDNLAIFGITPLKNNTNVFKATVRVSNEVRAVISNKGNRVYVGSQSCKVYDHFYVKRCFNCQEFGHYHKECTKKPVCGYCAEEHETKSCPNKSDSSKMCCINCKIQGSDTHQTTHSAYSWSCQSYVNAQDKLKRSIAFYQKNS